MREFLVARGPPMGCLTLMGLSSCFAMLSLGGLGKAGKVVREFLVAHGPPWRYLFLLGPILPIGLVQFSCIMKIRLCTSFALELSFWLI